MEVKVLKRHKKQIVLVAAMFLIALAYFVIGPQALFGIPFIPVVGMAGTISNVQKFVASDILIGIAQAGGVEPAAYTSLGLQSEKVVTYKLDEIVTKEGGGSGIQNGYDCDVRSEVLEVLSAATLDSTYKNQYVWLKCVPKGTLSATNPGRKFKNLICNMSMSGEMNPKGESKVTLGGTVWVNDVDDFTETFTA